MKVLEWVLAVLLAIALGGAALARLFSSTELDKQSDMLNIPGWFLVVVSIFELTLVLDLLMPRFRILGGVGAALTMAGAVLFNLLGDTVDGTDPRTAIPINVVLALIGLAVAWLAAGRPKQLTALLTTARQQMKGQFDSVAEAATDAIT